MSNIELTVTGSDVNVKGNRYGQTTVTIDDVDTDEILAAVSVRDVLSQFEVQELLKEVDINDVISWLQSEGYSISEA